MTKKQAMFEVWCWQYSNTNCFNQKLIDLYQAADGSNKRKLRAAYPEITEAVEIWANCENPESLFKEYEINQGE